MRRITAADFDPREGDLLDQDLLVEEVAADGMEGETLTLPVNTIVLAVQNSETDEHSVSEYTFRTSSGESWRVEVERMASGRGWLYPTRVYIEKQ
jgi:hypothetical protein